MNWKITWWDGSNLKELIIWSSAWDVVANASASGVMINSHGTPLEKSN